MCNGDSSARLSPSFFFLLPKFFQGLGDCFVHVVILVPERLYQGGHSRSLTNLPQGLGHCEAHIVVLILKRLDEDRHS